MYGPKKLYKSLSYESRFGPGSPRRPGSSERRRSPGETGAGVRCGPPSRAGPLADLVSRTQTRRGRSSVSKRRLDTGRREEKGRRGAGRM